MRRIGVGIIGAGAATQAIHLPALAALGDRLQPVHIADPDRIVGEEVAARVGARWSPDAQAVLDDAAVDIVAICSPDWLHADQVVASCRARKKAVLCEKPLAKTEADASRIAKASTCNSVPVIVGAMHRYDPAFVAARSAWRDFGSRRAFVRSAIYLPDNNEMTGLATDQAGSTITPGASPTPADTPEARAEAVRNAVLGLAIHNLPLIRTLMPGPLDVLEARWMRPYGYSITAGDGPRVARLSALMPGRWDPSWTLEAWDDRQYLQAKFPPSYVLAGSSVATFSTQGESRSWRFRESGYEAQWRHVADVAARRVVPDVSVNDAVADLRYAIAIGEGAARLVLEGTS
jgi:predicted dehydrogenase